MKIRIANLVAILVTIFSLTQINAQVQEVRLEQINEVFQTEELILMSGEYQFEIVNIGEVHDVGFAFVQKKKYEASDHIKIANVTNTVTTSGSSHKFLTPQVLPFCTHLTSFIA